eukprot:746423-Alexandrium_andersonii.AAC.1
MGWRSAAHRSCARPLPGLVPGFAYLFAPWPSAPATPTAESADLSHRKGSVQCNLFDVITHARCAGRGSART